MAIDSQHPEFAKHLPDWQQMRDTNEGERVIKGMGVKYLPPTPGQLIDNMAVGQLGYENYLAYKMRAVFPDEVNNAVTALVGVMHHKPPKIELPEKLQSMMENASVKGESLVTLLMRINEQQLITGRIGLFLDVQDGEDTPYIAVYEAETIINWDDGAREELVMQKLNMVVLDETEQVRTDNLEWEEQKKHRLLTLGAVGENMLAGTYRVRLFDDGGSDAEIGSLGEESFIVPSIKGATLDQIPFVFINSNDIVADPAKPPLLGLSNIVLSIYRSEADYRQALFMQGQDTLVVIGGIKDETKDTRVGAGAQLDVTTGGDAKYIGASSQGIPEMRIAIENDHKKASSAGSKILDSGGDGGEASGKALKIRVSAKTSSLVTVVNAAAAGLETLLKIAAVWVGADPDEVIIMPNTDFSDAQVTGRDVIDLQTAKGMGAPISDQTIHGFMLRGDITEMQYDEEIETIGDEEPRILGTIEGGDASDEGDQGQKQNQNEG